MLKTDAERFNNLAANDESTRIQAAEQLQQHKRFHFHDHPVGKFRFSPEQMASLLSAWHATSSDLLKVWIAQALALTGVATPEVLSVLADTTSHDGPYMKEVAMILRDYRTRIPEGNELLKSLHLHPNRDVRSCAAAAMDSMAFAKELDYDRDMPILRSLMLDTDATTRLHAVRAAEKMIGLGPTDYDVLLDVVNIDSGAARHYAKELLAKLELTALGCTPSAFAPREPLLRTDGVYYTNKAELDTDGVWVSSGCLRFFSDGSVHYFGTNEAPVDFPKYLPRCKPKVVRGAVTKDGANVAFSLVDDAGTVDYRGKIDGDKLHLRALHRGTSQLADEEYLWTYFDWNAATDKSVGAGQKLGGRNKNALSFVPVQPQSMRIADVAKWYVQMVARLPRMLEGAQDDAENVARAWHTKSDIRDTAARALYDPTLKKEFLAKMPLPSLDEIEGKEPAVALQMLLTVTQAEARAFPGTVGASIGLEYWDGKKKWVMTEDGRAPKP